MRKKYIILIPTVTLVVLGIALAILSIPPPKEPEVTPNPLNTLIYNELLEAGIRGAVVDVTAERALIRYNLPENMSKEDAEIQIMKIAAANTASNKIVVQTYENFKPIEEAIVEKNYVTDYINGIISLDELKKQIKINPLK